MITLILKARDTLIDAISILYVLLFVYAAFSKLLDLEKFMIQLSQSPLLTPFASWIAFLVPGIEIVLSIFLCLPQMRMIGLYGAFSLMVMFTAYIIAILNLTIYVPCSCGGVLEKLGWTEHLVFNIAFVLLAVVAIVLNAKSLRSKGLDDQSKLGSYE